MKHKIKTSLLALSLIASSAVADDDRFKDVQISSTQLSLTLHICLWDLAVILACQPAVMAY
ncbi:hypothetical protein [Vibrio lentus]|uniref:hypothetical protein n=1 Tax=Vibrio lentus TaxID=136468 RepID=UPI0039A75B34